MPAMHINGALDEFPIEPSVRALPPFDMCGRTVLDVGCANGKDLAHPAYAQAREKWGIDPDERGIEAGSKLFPGVILVRGEAESLPFPDEHFDVVTCRVALPYTDVGRALREIARVMKPDGHLCLTLHDWRLHACYVREACRGRDWKRLVNLTYVTAAGLCYAGTGWTPRRPWGGVRETFQFVSKTRATLRKLGFDRISHERQDRNCIVTARRRR